MEIRAKACGYGPGNILTGIGQVETVFDHAVNIRLDNKLCLTLASDMLDLAPNRVILSNEDFKRITVRPGDQVRVTEGCFWHRAFQIRFEPGSPSVMEISPPGVATIGELKKALATGTGPGIVYLGLSKGCNLGDREVAKLSGMLKEDIRVGLSLVGLGIGFTPAGDDVLIGFCSTASRLGWLDKAWHTELTEKAFQQSTSLSATGIFFAGKGLVQQLLDKVLTNFNTRDLRGACRQLIDNVGSTSGSDMLLGVLVACQYHLGVIADE